MASPLEAQIAKAIYQGLKGKLLTGTLRRQVPSSSLDEFGDPESTTDTDYPFDGYRDEYSLFTRANAGIPDGDVKIGIIAQSCAVTPQKDDRVLLRGQWFQIRGVKGDPANAVWECQSFQTEDQ